jgi:hypothetical protein
MKGKVQTMSFPTFQDMERRHGIQWGQIVELEPDLQQLLWEARSAGADCRSWLDVNRIFSPLRDRLAQRVGFAGKHRDHPVLGTIGAYEVAYWRLHDAVAGLLPRF